MKRILILCVGLLFLLTAGCGGGSKSYSSGTPEEVAKSYYEALKDGKPEIAWDLRKFDPPVSKEEFVKEKKGSTMPIKGVSVDKAKVEGNKAYVTVKLETGNSSMPEIPMNVTLEKGTAWKITGTGMGSGTGMGANPHASTSGAAYGSGAPGGMPGGVPGMPPASGLMPSTPSK